MYSYSHELNPTKGWFSPYALDKLQTWRRIPRRSLWAACAR